MFQRIQTFYLFLVSVCMAVSMFSPLAIMAYDGNFVALNAFSFLKGADIAFETGSLFVIGLVSSLISLVSIFLYKNRKSQIRITKSNIFVMIFFLAYMVFLIFKNDNDYGTFTSFSWGTVIPLIAIIFAFFSIKHIKKDESLVRSLDRLR